MDAMIRCEEYDIEADAWQELPYLNVGRYYHSAAVFFNKFVYVFGGISQKISGKYLNTVEFLNLEKKNCWDIISFQDNEFPKRQGCGAMQLDDYQILIFGGYSGDFLKDSYLFNVNTKLMTKTMDMPIECLPY